jgi:hypothetical protein
MTVKAGSSGATDNPFCGARRSTGLKGVDSGWLDCTTHFHHPDFRNLGPRLLYQSCAGCSQAPMTCKLQHCSIGWESGDAGCGGRYVERRVTEEG